uniref:Putative plant transposon protein domain-containing protein n=1 Tax=Solanum tuberosum TaxID=4113 RepID=M1DBC8_SOLTU
MLAKRFSDSPFDLRSPFIHVHTAERSVLLADIFVVAEVHQAAGLLHSLLGLGILLSLWGVGPEYKKKASEFRPVKSVLSMLIVPSLYDLKGWLARIIFDITPKWLDAGVPIQKRDMNISSRYWFGFISITIMPSQNESILRQPKVACLGSIMARSDIEVTPFSSTDIQCIEEEFTREEDERRRAAPTDTSLEAPGASSSSQPTRITQAMILMMGQLAYSVDVRATRLEMSVLEMIDRAILAALTPI